MVTVKEMMETVDANIPGTNEHIAAMLGCHVNTLAKLRRGDENIRMQLYLNLEQIYRKAIKVKKVMES